MNFPRKEKHPCYNASHFQRGVIFLSFGPWALSLLLGTSNSLHPPHQGFCKGRGAAQMWGDNTWHERPFLKELASQGAISPSHFVWVAAYRLFNLLVGSEELQTRQKLWVRQKGVFRKAEDAALAVQSLVKFEHPYYFPFSTMLQYALFKPKWTFSSGN